MFDKIKGNINTLSGSDLQKIIRRIWIARQVFRKYWITQSMTVGQITTEIDDALREAGEAIEIPAS
jgi:hypothetical protein